jgi:glutathione S-transferase kappa 1
MAALEGVFSKEDLEHIVDGSMKSENKKRVVDTTMSVRAFGAPWITATNKDGERKDWFGNDRWHQVFHHLGVPYTPITIKQASIGKANL